MNAVEKKCLAEEARLQTQALQKIGHWRTIALAVSASGAAFAYAGFAGIKGTYFCSVFGIILLVLGIICAAILNLGIKNGRCNVEKILHVLDGTMDTKGWEETL